MTAHKTKPSNLAEWLTYIEALHPKSIAMGLDRVQTVANKLQLEPKFPIITVAGTNGKGSVCATLSRIYAQAGYGVGCYTSPHLNRYNERVSVNLQPISDDDLCLAFAAVEAARSDVALTYFEIGTLAAMWHFCRPNLGVSLDILILEVGLGGRLDAVNIFEPACSIVTTIDLDHMEYLGDTREKIGYEKAGIFRANKLAICGDEHPPQSLVNYAGNLGANLALINRDFKIKKTESGAQYCAANATIALPNFSLLGDFQLNNAACALRAVQALKTMLPVTDTSIYEALKAVKLPGRFQQIHVQPAIFVDVAHNPQAAKSLAHNLEKTACAGRTLAVFAMLADKDINGVVSAVATKIDAWYVADIHAARGAKASDLRVKILTNTHSATVYLHADVALAIDAAYKNATKNDRIIIFGSFYTVADAVTSKFYQLEGEN